MKPISLIVSFLFSVLLISTSLPSLTHAANGGRKLGQSGLDTVLSTITSLLKPADQSTNAASGRGSDSNGNGNGDATLAPGLGGSWKVLQQSIGVSAMHMQLLNNDRVVVFDRTDFGPSNLSLPAGNCPKNSKDCTAHSAEYDVLADTFRPLTVQTNVWCSSGAVMDDGTLIQCGGSFEGERRVRVFKPCSDSSCDWSEIKLGLAKSRWYATNHILPDGRTIILGGRRQFNYEFHPKVVDNKVYDLQFLADTNEQGIENNLYPFVFLNVDGNLFVFANNRAILLDYKKNQVVRTYPQIPGGDPRSYPSTGSAVLLPLKNINNQAETVKAEVLVCGGAPKGSFTKAVKREFVDALKTCARIVITDPKPEWVVEDMPLARVMGDMTLLPNGDVLLVNGARAGAAGWESADKPVLNPVLYRPDNTEGSRFEVQNPSETPRLYHSSAVLLRDGRVLVGGSNPHSGYEFSGVRFRTELSLEAFSPSYLDEPDLRPVIISPASPTELTHSQKFKVQFQVKGIILERKSVQTTIVSPSFSTHSFSMNQRLLVLPTSGVKRLGKIKATYEIEVETPRSSNLAPSGYYLFFVVHKNIPSKGIWVHIK
ncbi:1,4-alpha-glucan-branching enzyme [Parasponia andersonii]|uniref:1,4-alpha-glucan-branching enzyme n=1 Tax=Parasponia andersonii TaxID=3476 RepID=A0A2P5DBY0_PARAD|nr:1,4-alpha-glucan-branching enzyme [Parasponia andersonii]